MQDVEEMMITHGEDVAAAVRAEPAALKERMRTTPLDESSGWTRWKQLYWYAMLMVSVTDGVVGYTNFIVDLIIRKLDKTHRGHNQREALDEDVLLEGVLGNTRVRAKFMKKLKDYKGAPISQFRFAKVMGGMTQRGFNALRWELLNRAIGANSRRRIGRGEEATSHQEAPYGFEELFEEGTIYLPLWTAMDRVRAVAR